MVNCKKFDAHTHQEMPVGNEHANDLGDKAGIFQWYRNRWHLQE